MVAASRLTGATAPVEWLDEVRSAGVRERRFDIRREGRIIPGVLWTPAAEGAERPLVLIGHGASGSKREGYVVALARRLVRHHGLAAAAIDGPVHGDRRDDPNPPAGLSLLEFSQAWSSDPDMTDEMVADWRATIDVLSTVEGLETSAVGWWGLSMGTIIGLPFVAAERRIGAAVLGLMGLTGPTRARLAADTPAVSCPVLYLVQLQDELFPLPTALELFARIGTTDKRLHAHPGHHGEVPDEELAASAAFLVDRLA